MLTCAAILAFIANEPVLVVLGHRGERRQRLEGARARRWLAITGSGAAALGVVGLGLASTEARQTAALVAVPAASLIVLGILGRAHSWQGELIAAIALPGAAAPVAVASGVAPTTALAIWAVWTVGFACTIAAVHRVLARNRHPAAAIDLVLAIAITAITVTSGALAWTAPLAAAAIPLAVVSAAIITRPPRAARLRAIGVVLVIASVATAVVVWGALR